MAILPSFIGRGGGVISYPPPPDIRYGDLVRLRNLARKAGLEGVTRDLQRRLDRFFRKPDTDPAQNPLFLIWRS